jgi:hypothetical protein
MHPPSSSVHVLQAKVTVCQQKSVSVIIRRVRHLPSTSLIRRLRTRRPFVVRRLDRLVGLKVATRVWRCMPRQMLVFCVSSVLAPTEPRPYSAKSGVEEKVHQSESTVAYRIVLYMVTWQDFFAIAVIQRRLY